MGMNRFDEKYDIRFAKYDEIPKVMEFIDEHWKKGHILATNRSFFEYEYYLDGQVNFLIAITKEEGIIEGVIGYVPASDNKDKLVIWGTVWKVKDGAMSMLGMELKKRLIAYSECRTEMGVGANIDTSVPLLKMLLRYKTGRMKHFYMLSKREKYSVAKVNQMKENTPCKDKFTKVTEFTSINEVQKVFDFDICKDCIPYKNAWYVEHRYFGHPIHDYRVFGLEGDNGTQALLVLRIQECLGEKVVRIVDYIGNQELFSGLNEFFTEWLKQAEYIDFYCLGFSEEYILASGMVERDEEDVNIIPNYFAPFVCENIDIYVVSPKENCLFFKADGDQDRPN